MNLGIDYKSMTGWCVENENHPALSHQEDGIQVPNQFSDTLRSYVRGATEGSNPDEHDCIDDEQSKEIQFYQTYNPFTFGIPCFADLYWALNKFFYEHDQVKEAGEPYYIHGWFNVYHSKVGEEGYDHIPWHRHLHTLHPHIYHGFYCANVQPSETWYRYSAQSPEEDIVKIPDYDDMLIFSQSGYEHCSSAWKGEVPRVTVAFDIMPESVYLGLQEIGDSDYHWSLDSKQYQAIPFPYLP